MVEQYKYLKWGVICSTSYDIIRHQFKYTYWCICNILMYAFTSQCIYIAIPIWLSWFISGVLNQQCCCKTSMENSRGGDPQGTIYCILWLNACVVWYRPANFSCQTYSCVVFCDKWEKKATKHFVDMASPICQQIIAPTLLNLRNDPPLCQHGQPAFGQTHEKVKGWQPKRIPFSVDGLIGNPTSSGTKRQLTWFETWRVP